MSVDSGRVRIIDSDGSRPGNADAMSLRALQVGLALMAVGALAFAVTSLQLVWPGFLGGVAFLSYGRLLPVATNVLVFGGVAVGLIGAAQLVVSRETGLPVWGGRAQILGLALVAGGVVAGAGAVAFGLTEGRELAELPLWADVAVAAGLLGSAFVATRTADLAADRVTPPAVWFVLGGLWWAALAYVAGNLPGLAGVNAAIQSAFATGSLLLGAIPALAVGILYHVVAGLPEPAGEEDGAEDDEAAAPPDEVPEDPDQLARIGFWSLFFAAGWVGARWLVHGPAPDWLETIGAVFSIVYLVPVLAIGADLLRRVRGVWPLVGGETGMRFLAAALAAFVVAGVVNLVHALRGSGAVVNLTLWSHAFLVLVVFGLAGSVLAGLVHHLRGSGRAGRGHFALALAGLGITAGALWTAGLHQGWSWVAAANTPDLTAAGSAFASSVDPLEAWLVLAAIGTVLLLASQALTAVVPWRPPAERAVAEPAPADLPPAEEEAAPEGAAAAHPLRVVVQGAVGLFLLGAVAVMIVPTFEQAHRDESLLAVARDFPDGTPEADGRALYVSEGCVYCHTQQVRAIVTDVGLGPASQPGDYAEAVPALLGSARIGPDLMHAGAREPTDSARFLRDHLADPRAERPWSIMPSYDYLSTADLQALAQYLAALR